MKLLFIYLILTIIFLVVEMDFLRNATSGEDVADDSADKEYISSLPQEQKIHYNLLCAYLLVKQSFTPVKQIDLPDDGGASSCFPYKTCHSGPDSEPFWQIRLINSQKFLRLLSERHTNGFYTYSLGKLII